MAEQQFVRVRIPQALFDEMQKVMNQVPISESDGSIKRVNEEFGLSDSHTALVNTMHLALLSDILPASRLALLIQLTPGVNKTFVNEARKRLFPNQTVSVSANAIAELQDSQNDGFRALADVLEQMYVGQEQTEGQVLKDNGTMLQLMSYLIGAMSQENVADTNTYNDEVTSAVKKAVQPYGDQHERDVRSKHRKERQQENT